MVTLDDKYTARSGRIYVTGSQALVRLPMMQHWLDTDAGLNTAGFISGYRGSPLGIYDLALWQAQSHLEANGILFQPGVNEDLAATAVWGTQQISDIGTTAYDGVFSIWYGKGPGVDRSGDALKHGSFAGASQHGGVLALCGDDHGARSSTIAHQSDHALIHFGMPVFNPSDVQDYLDLGLAAFAMSRYSGAWVGFKCVTDTVESSASVIIDPARFKFQTPTDFLPPPEGLHHRLGVWPLASETRQFDQRLKAVQAFARINQIDKLTFGRSGKRRLGIITTGKAYYDVIEALRDLGIDEATAQAIGIGVFKVRMPWPLEPQGISAFAADCDELLVVEEKRAVIEEQLAHILYNLPTGRRPRLSGKSAADGAPLLPQTGELTPAIVRDVLRNRLLALDFDEQAQQQLRRIYDAPDAKDVDTGTAHITRQPSFCAGCPHNTSTNVPEGSIAMGGIGCHGLATWLPDRRTLTLYHMGGEGSAWIGQAPFVSEEHIFQNLGDGTYFHSGLLAVRACVAADVNITYKILLNGAVGMTGGQPIEGEAFASDLTAPHVAMQLDAEGVRRIAVVSDDENQFRTSDFPKGVTFHHRDALDAVQRDIRSVKGVSAIIYAQSCATERRRLRKRGKVADPDKRLFIAPSVCEGCGDCGVQSNCIALEPEETQLGRKRRINQSVCNKDYSCQKGLCPSFVTVEGGKPRKATSLGSAIDRKVIAALPLPKTAEIVDAYSMLIAGIGGNGVVTIGAILGMAAHIEGHGVSVMDMSGLAQRNGPVTSHLRLTPMNSRAHTPRIPDGAADLIIGCDLVVAASAENLSKMASHRTAVVYNTFVAPTSGFASDPNLDMGSGRLAKLLSTRSVDGKASGMNATRIAMALLGDAIGANIFLIGYAWQKGLIPISQDNLEAAINLNGTAITLNLNAFALGRLAAAAPETFDSLLPAKQSATQASETDSLESRVAVRRDLLAKFQDIGLADRYEALVNRVAQHETRIAGAPGAFAMAVAKAYGNVLYYKDEYEVGRLFTEPGFRASLEETFEGKFSIRFNLAPPLLSKRDSDGRPKKTSFGAWILPLFSLLAALRKLRGTPFDIFGLSKHRKMERSLPIEFESLIETLMTKLTAANADEVAAIADLYNNVRGYDVVKDRNVERTRADVARRLKALTAPTETTSAQSHKTSLIGT